MMSETLKAIEIDVKTGVVTDRELTVEESAQHKKDLTIAKKIESDAKAKSEARLSALAKLAALGLTEEEIGAL
jgi:hypothetical protein